MVTIKSYTDLEQSKVLATILPLESADMYYEPSTGYRTEPSEVRFGDIKYAHPRSIRCWSLAALLGVASKEVSLNSFKDGNWNAMVQQNDKMIYSDADNPVDACYGMILKLHELKNK